MGKRIPCLMTPWIIWTVITFLVVGYLLASLRFEATIVGLVIVAIYLVGLSLGLYCVMVVDRLRIEMKKELLTEMASYQIDIEDPDPAPPSGFLNFASFKFKSKMKNESVNINYQQFN